MMIIVLYVEVIELIVNKEMIKVLNVVALMEHLKVKKKLVKNVQKKQRNVKKLMI